MHLDFLRAKWPVALAAVECFALASIAPLAANAQTAPASAASASAQDRQMIDRAEGEGDKVFKWILIHSDKPRKSGAAKDDKPASTASAAKALPKPAARSDDQAKTTTAAVTVPAAAVSATGSTDTGAAKPPTPAATPTIASTSQDLTTAVSSSSPSEAPPAQAAMTTPDLQRDASPSRNESAAPPPVVDAANEAATSAVKPEKADLLAAASPSSASKAPAEAAAEDSGAEILRPIQRVDPKIPWNMLSTARGGHVEVRFTVQPDGSVRDATAGAATNRRLIPYAVDAVSQWKFAPLKRPQNGAVDLVFDFE